MTTKHPFHLKKLLVERREHAYEVAQRAGISETRMSRITTGRALPTDDEKRAIAMAMSLPVSVCFPKR